MYKFLLDENLSRRLTKALGEFGEVRHVSKKDLMENNDSDIWQFSKHEGFTIVNQDNDFKYLSRTLSCPPKVIKLNCGNRSTNFIASMLLDHKEVVMDFMLSEELCYLEIG
jgi:predicted nuclease of predicted toxin-antitoxin system